MSQPTLILAGGGHTHVLVIRRLARNTLPGVRVVLVSEQPTAPYSGMLPGLIAGHYRVEETHIDLQRLCLRAGIEFVQGRMIGLDPSTQRLHLAGQPALPYDRISINTGATPNTEIPGAEHFALGVKPVSGLYQQWLTRLEQLSRNPPDSVQHWGVVGAGAGGVELVLAMAHKIHTLFPHTGPVRWHLIFRGESILPGYPARLRRKVEQALAQAGIQCHADFTVQRIAADHIVSTHGTVLPMHYTVLCTPAAPPQWPQECGLDTANGGFIAVNEFLQSTSHPRVFAAGDVAEMVADPRSKAGVYAVRQARFLEQNLRHAFRDEPLQIMRLQRQFLSLLALGDKTAVGRRGPFTFSGQWVWRWKNRIDRDFMALFV